MRVIHLVLSLDTGGAEVLIVHMATAQKKRGHDVSVICLDAQGPLAAELLEHNVKIECLNREAGLFDFNAFSKLKSILRDSLTAKGDSEIVLHTHNFEAGFYGALAAFFTSIPILHMQHGKPVPWNVKSWLRSKVMKLGINRYIGVSNTVTSHCQELGWFPKNNSRTILNGVDTQWFCPEDTVVIQEGKRVREELDLNDNCIIYICIARMAPVKDHETLIKGFAKFCEDCEVSNNNTERILLLIGEGPCRPELEQLTNILGMNNKILFKGEIRNVRPWLAAADYFMLNSRSEGISVSIMEAMAMSVIPVVSNVGGNHLLVSDGIDGYLFEAQSSEKTSACLKRTRMPLSAQGAMKHQCRNKILKQFDQKKMHDDYEKEYRSIMKKQL